MSKNRRGRAVIINNFDFGDAEVNRYGTNSDKKRLAELFTKLFFDTFIHDDLKAEVRNVQYVLYLLSNFD